MRSRLMVDMYAYIPVSWDGKDHGNPEIQENTVLVGPVGKYHNKNIEKETEQVVRM